MVPNSGAEKVPHSDASYNLTAEIGMEIYPTKLVPRIPAT